MCASASAASRDQRYCDRCHPLLIVAAFLLTRAAAACVQSDRILLGALLMVRSSHAFTAVKLGSQVSVLTRFMRPTRSLRERQSFSSAPLSLTVTSLLLLF